jgi:DNA mismatch endonuclease (patch repair protein)
MRETVALDNKSKEERSRNMAAVKDKDTDIEMTLRKALWREGLRYRVVNKLPGHPDIIFPGKRIAIFCDGCFWHGCPKCREIPIQNREFWIKKIIADEKRDRRVNEELTALGWMVLRYWGCEIHRELSRIVNDIKNRVKKNEIPG